MKILDSKKLDEYRKLIIGGSRDYFLIKELDEVRRIYQVIKVEFKGNSVRVINSELGIHKNDLGEDEKHIFTNGRSKSKYENAVSVYNYYGVKDLSCNSISFVNVDKSDVEFYEYLNNITEISSSDLSNKTYAFYFDNLRDDFNCGKTVFSDKYYVGSEKVSRIKSIEFLLNIMKLINFESIVKASWRYDTVSKLSILKLKSNIGVEIIVTGFDFGKGNSDINTLAAYNCLLKCNFNKSSCAEIITNSTGTIEK